MMRSKVIKCFRTLHRTRLEVFRGDDRALTEARKRINDEFTKNKYEEDPEKIKDINICKAGIAPEAIRWRRSANNVTNFGVVDVNWSACVDWRQMLKVAEDVNKLLRMTVVQGVMKENNRIELKVTKDTVLLDSPPLPKDKR